jgi:hypothetical protein
MLRSLTVLPDLRLVDPALDDQLLCIVFTPPSRTAPAKPPTTATATTAPMDGGRSVARSCRDIGPYRTDGACCRRSAGPGVVAENVALIQGRFLSRGNFEMLAPLANGGLAHYSAVNVDGALPWFGPNVFATDVGRFDAVSLIQSNFTAGGHVGNLEAVARMQGQLVAFWREDVQPYVWHGPTLIPLSGPGGNARTVTGNPSLIQGRFGGRWNR